MPDDARITRDRRAEGLVERLRNVFGYTTHRYACDQRVRATKCSCGLVEAQDQALEAADVLSAAQRLILEWREKADRFDAEAQTDRGASITTGLEWEASRMRDCASELAALLSDPIPRAPEET